MISHRPCSFFHAYDPGQCLSIDDTMIKSKGHAKGMQSVHAQKTSQAWHQDVLSCFC